MSPHWSMRAACDGHLDEAYGDQPRLFIHTYCRTCPVITECLDEALRMRDVHGVWGGKTPHERQQYAKQIGYQAPPINNCGTYAGHRIHKYRKEPSCRACINAARAYYRERDHHYRNKQKTAT